MIAFSALIPQPGTVAIPIIAVGVDRFDAAAAAPPSVEIDLINMTCDLCVCVSLGVFNVKRNVIAHKSRLSFPHILPLL